MCVFASYGLRDGISLSTGTLACNAGGLWACNQVFSRHLGFAKHGELGRVKEGEEGGGEGLEYFSPLPRLSA